MSTTAASGDLRLIPARKVGPHEYEQLLGRIRSVVDASLPSHATVLVVSKGDNEILELGGRRGWHFPQTDAGEYVGFHPASSADAIAHLEQLRARGAEYLLIPSSAFWWLNYYGELTQYLQRAYRVVVRQEETCLIFALAEKATRTSDVPGDDVENLARQCRDLARSLLPRGAVVAVLSGGDDGLLELDGVQSMHFPCTGDGGHLRAAVRDASAARMHVETAQANGAEFLIVPRPAAPGSNRHLGLSEHLQRGHRLVTRQRHVCEIWELMLPDQSEPRLATRNGSDDD